MSLASFYPPGTAMASMYKEAPPLAKFTDERDITRKHLAATRLCNYVSEKDTVLSNSHIEAQLFVICDQTLPDCPIMYASEGFLAMTGYTRREVLGRNCRFLQGPDTNPESVLAIRHSVHTSQALTINLLNYKKNGETFWNMLQLTPVMDAHGVCTAIVGSQSELPENVPIEECFGAMTKIDDIFGENDEKVCGDAAGGLSFIIATPMVPDFLITHASESFFALTGYTKDEIIGQSCTRFMEGKDTDPSTLLGMEGALKVGRSTADKVLNYKKDGTSFWDMVHINPVSDKMGKVRRIIMVHKEVGAGEVEAHKSSSEIVSGQLAELSECILQFGAA